MNLKTDLRTQRELKRFAAEFGVDAEKFKREAIQEKMASDLNLLKKTDQKRSLQLIKEDL